MLRVQAGDLEAFAQLVQRFQNVVYGLAITMLRRPEDAEEAAQDTFLKVFRARGTFDPARQLEPWLLRIAGNACRDKLRRRKAAALPAMAVGEDLVMQVADPRERPSHHRQTDQAVRAELDRLSDKIRQPIELKYLRGMTNQQIADALGISVSNVKVQIARGKDILQSRLQQVREA